MTSDKNFVEWIVKLLEYGIKNIPRKEKAIFLKYFQIINEAVKIKEIKKYDS